MLDDAATTDDGRHADADAANAVRTVHERRNRHDALAVERDGIDDGADGGSDSPAGTALAGNDFSSGLFRAFENLILPARRNVFELGEREAGDAGGRPDREHGVAVFAEDQSVDLRRSDAEGFRDESVEAGGVEHGSQAQDLLCGQTQEFNGELRENIDRVRDDEHDGVALQAGILDFTEDGFEKRNVAVDEVEAGFVRLAAQTGGDDDAVHIGAIGIGTGADDLVAAEGSAVQEVESFAFRHCLINVETYDLADYAGALKRKCGIGTYAPAGADNSNFHHDFLRNI